MHSDASSSATTTSTTLPSSYSPPAEMPPAASHDDPAPALPEHPPASAKPDTDDPTRASSDVGPDGLRARFPTSPFAGRPSVASSRHFLTVLPPVDFSSLAPHPRAAAAAAGTTANLSRGCLLPLYPTLGGQLYAIAREYGLPSIGGLSVYLVDDGFGSLGPCVGDSSWRAIWAPYFAQDGPLNQPHSASYSSTSFPSRSRPSTALGVDAETSFGLATPRLPIVGRIEWAVEPSRATWWPAWLAETRTAAGLPPNPLDPTPAAPQPYSNPYTSPYTLGRAAAASEREHPASSGVWPTHKPLTLGNPDLGNSTSSSAAGHPSSGLAETARSDRGFASPRVSMTPAASRSLAHARAARLQSLPQMQLQALARSASPGIIPIHSPRAFRVASTPTFPHAPGSMPLPSRPLPELEPQPVPPRRLPALTAISTAKRRGSPRTLSLLSKPPSTDFSPHRSNVPSLQDQAQSQPDPVAPSGKSDPWSSRPATSLPQQDGTESSHQRSSSALWPTPDSCPGADRESKDSSSGLDDVSAPAVQQKENLAPVPSSPSITEGDPSLSTQGPVTPAEPDTVASPTKNESVTARSLNQEPERPTSVISDPSSRSILPRVPSEQPSLPGGEDAELEQPRRSSAASSVASEPHGSEADWRDTPYEPLDDPEHPTESADAAPELESTRELEPTASPVSHSEAVPDPPTAHRKSTVDAWQSFDIDEEEWDALAAAPPAVGMPQVGSTPPTSASQGEATGLFAQPHEQRPISGFSLSSLGFNMDIDPPPGAGPVAEKVRELEASEREHDEGEMPPQDDVGDVLSLWANPNRPQDKSPFLLSPLHLDTPQFTLQNRQGTPELDNHTIQPPVAAAAEEEEDQTQGLSESHSHYTVVALSPSSAGPGPPEGSRHGRTPSRPQEAAIAAASAKSIAAGPDEQAMPESWSEWSLHSSQSMTEADQAAVKEIIDQPPMGSGPSQQLCDAADPSDNEPGDRSPKGTPPASQSKPELCEGEAYHMSVPVERSESVNTELSSSGAGDPLTTIEKALQLLSPTGTARDNAALTGPTPLNAVPRGLPGSTSSAHSLAAALVGTEPAKEASAGPERSASQGGVDNMPFPRAQSFAGTGMIATASLPHMSRDLSSASVPTTMATASPVKHRFGPSTPKLEQGDSQSNPVPTLGDRSPGQASSTSPVTPVAPLSHPLEALGDMGHHTATDTEDDYQTVAESPSQMQMQLSPSPPSPNPAVLSPMDADMSHVTTLDPDETPNATLPTPRPPTLEGHLNLPHRPISAASSPFASEAGSSTVGQVARQEAEQIPTGSSLPFNEDQGVAPVHADNGLSHRNLPEEGTADQMDPEDGDVTNSTAMPNSIFDHATRVDQSGPSSSQSIETIYSRPSAADLMDSEDAPAVPPTVPEVEETCPVEQVPITTRHQAAEEIQEFEATPRAPSAPFPPLSSDEEQEDDLSTGPRPPRERPPPIRISQPTSLSSASDEDGGSEAHLPPSKFSDSSSDKFMVTDPLDPSERASEMSTMRDMPSPPPVANGIHGGSSQPSRSIAALLSNYQQMSAAPQASPRRLDSLLDGDPDPFRPSGPAAGSSAFPAQGAGAMYDFSSGAGLPSTPPYHPGMAYTAGPGLTSAPPAGGSYTLGYLVGAAPSEMVGTPLIAQSIEEVDEPALSAPSSSYSLVSPTERYDEDNLPELRAMPAPPSGLLSEAAGTLASKPSSVLIHEDSLCSSPSTPKKNGWRPPEEAREMMHSDGGLRLSSHIGSDDEFSSAPPGSESSVVFQYRLSHERETAEEHQDKQHMPPSTSQTDLFDVSGMPSMQALMDGTMADLSRDNTPSVPQDEFRPFGGFEDEQSASRGNAPTVPQDGHHASKDIKEEHKEPRADSHAFEDEGMAPPRGFPSTERGDRTSVAETEDTAPTPMMPNRALARHASMESAPADGEAFESILAPSAPLPLSPKQPKGWAGANEAHDILRRGSTMSQWHRSISNAYRQSDMTAYSSHPGDSRTTSRAWSRDESDVARSERDERDRVPVHQSHACPSEGGETVNESMPSSPQDLKNEQTWSPPSTTTIRSARPPPVSVSQQPILGLGLGLTLGEESEGSRRPPPLRLRKWTGTSPASKTAPLPLEDDNRGFSMGHGPTAQDDLSLPGDLDIEGRLDDMPMFAANLPNGHNPNSSSPSRAMGTSSPSHMKAHGPMPRSVSNATVTTSTSTGTVMPQRFYPAHGDESESFKPSPARSPHAQYQASMTDSMEQEPHAVPHLQHGSPRNEAQPLPPWELSSFPPLPPGGASPASWPTGRHVSPIPTTRLAGLGHFPNPHGPGTPTTPYSAGSGPSPSQAPLPSPAPGEASRSILRLRRVKSHNQLGEDRPSGPKASSVTGKTVQSPSRARRVLAAAMPIRRNSSNSSAQSPGVSRFSDLPPSPHLNRFTDVLPPSPKMSAALGLAHRLAHTTTTTNATPNDARAPFAPLGAN